MLKWKNMNPLFCPIASHLDYHFVNCTPQLKKKKRVGDLAYHQSIPVKNELRC